MQVTSYAFKRGIEPSADNDFKWWDNLLIRKHVVQLGCTIMKREDLHKLLAACKTKKREAFSCTYKNYLDECRSVTVLVMFRDGLIGLDCDTTNLVRWFNQDWLIQRIERILNNGL